MKVKCVFNQAKDLPKDFLSIEHYRQDRIFTLTINKAYTVNAILICKEGLLYSICHDQYLYYPLWFPAALFEIVNPNLSKYWTIGPNDEEYDEDVIAILAFPEWATNPYYYTNLVDGEDNEVHIFQKYKQLMDLEFPDPEITDKATALENGWVMCPHCIDAWQPLTKDGMIICPNCKNVMHNPYFERIIP